MVGTPPGRSIGVDNRSDLGGPDGAAGGEHRQAHLDALGLAGDEFDRAAGEDQAAVGDPQLGGAVAVALHRGGEADQLALVGEGGAGGERGDGDLGVGQAGDGVAADVDAGVAEGGERLGEGGGVARVAAVGEEHDAAGGVVGQREAGGGQGREQVAARAEAVVGDAGAPPLQGLAQGGGVVEAAEAAGGGEQRVGVAGVQRRDRVVDVVEAGRGVGEVDRGGDVDDEDRVDAVGRGVERGPAQAEHEQHDGECPQREGGVLLERRPVGERPPQAQAGDRDEQQQPQRPGLGEVEGGEGGGRGGNGHAQPTFRRW